MKLPLTTLEDNKCLPIGTFVSFNHRAGVARFKKRANPEIGKENKQGWVITDGVNSNELIPIESDSIVDHIFDLEKFSIWDNRLKYAFFNCPQAKTTLKQNYNKTVLVWPEEGSGYIIGKIRKSIGVSFRGYRNSFSGEYEAGYHDSDIYVDLYVVKTAYSGTDYILCPIWAVQTND